MGGTVHVWRGLRDVVSNFPPFLLANVGWWICVALIIPAPSATVALMRIADPRHGVESERPGWRETAQTIWDDLWSSWMLALMTVPVIVVLVFNVWFYQASGGRLVVLAPATIFLLVVAVMVALLAFSAIALREDSSLRSLRSAMIAIARQFGATLTCTLAILIILVLGFVLLVPMFLIVPALVAAIVNRLALAGWGVTLVDPLQPTPERLAERASRKES